MTRNAQGPSIRNMIAELVHGESGQDVIEYALVAVFIGMGAVASLSGLAGKLIAVFGALGSTLTGAV